jgi:hypothetical protein
MLSDHRDVILAIERCSHFLGTKDSTRQGVMATSQEACSVRWRGRYGSLCQGQVTLSIIDDNAFRYGPVLSDIDPAYADIPRRHSLSSWHAHKGCQDPAGNHLDHDALARNKRMSSTGNARRPRVAMHYRARLLETTRYS